MNAPSNRAVPASRSFVAQVLYEGRKGLIAVGVFSCAINVLMLTGSFFMLQVYDRVIPSRSMPTLLGLYAFIVVLYSFHGVFDAIRGRLLVRIGLSLDERLRRQAYETVVRLPLMSAAKSDGLQPVRDLDQIRSFLSSVGPTALFDLPWMPLYLLLCFAFHVWIGVTATIGAILLVSLTLLTEKFTRDPVKAAAVSGAARLGSFKAVTW